MTPEVSVVVPTRDRGGLLVWAVWSALRQRGVGVEVVVVDDGSVPGSVPAALAGLVADGRVRVVRLPVSLGVSAARNAGVRVAAGRWVAFLDDDDVWAPGKLAAQLVEAQASGRGWVYGGDVNVDVGLRVLGGGPPLAPEEVMAGLERFNAVPAGASNVVVRADVLAAAGPFDPGLRNNEDWDMWLRLARLGPPASVRRPLVALRIHPGNASRDMERMFTELAIITRRHGLSPDLAAHYRWAAWVRLGERRRLAATRYYARAVRTGDVGSLARIPVALLRPSVAAAAAATPVGVMWPADDWGAEAAGWLDELRRCPGPPP